MPVQRRHLLLKKKKGCHCAIYKWELRWIYLPHWRDTSSCHGYQEGTRVPIQDQAPIENTRNEVPQRPFSINAVLHRSYRVTLCRGLWKVFLCGLRIPHWSCFEPKQEKWRTTLLLPLLRIDGASNYHPFRLGHKHKLQGGLRGELLHPPTATQPEEDDCHLQVRRRPTPGQAQDWGSCQTDGQQGQEKQNGPNSMCFQVCAPSKAFCERKEAYSEIIRLVKRGCATQIGSCAESTASYPTGSNHQWNTVAHYWPLPRDAGRLGMMMMITMKTTSEDGLQQMPV